jgi:hypothetical protein
MLVSCLQKLLWYKARLLGHERLANAELDTTRGWSQGMLVIDVQSLTVAVLHAVGVRSLEKWSHVHGR